jgi:hypothetical protein
VDESDVPFSSIIGGVSFELDTLVGPGAPQPRPDRMDRDARP